MSGKDIRMGKLFSRGKAVIVAVDHAGNPTVVHWLPMLKKIQNKGKVLYIYSSVKEVKELV